VEEVSANSAEFARLWRRYDLRYRRSEAKAFHHLEVVDFTLGFEVLNLDNGLRLSILQAEPARPTTTRSSCSLSLALLDRPAIIEQFHPCCDRFVTV
jgi:hypothetical protein